MNLAEAKCREKLSERYRAPKLVHSDPRHRRSKKVQSAPLWKECSWTEPLLLKALTLWHGRHLVLDSQDELGLPGEVLAAALLVLQDDGDPAGQVVQAVDHGRIRVGLRGTRQTSSHWATGTRNYSDDGWEVKWFTKNQPLHWKKNRIFSTSNQAAAQRCPNVIWISKLVYTHQRNTTPGWFVFPVVNGPSTSREQRTQLHTVRQESVKLFQKAEYPNVQVKLTGSTRAAVPLTCPTHSTLPHWCLPYVLTRQ